LLLPQKTKNNSIFYIFFFSLLLHLILLFFIRGIPFIRLPQLSINNNKITIDLQTYQPDTRLNNLPEIPTINVNENIEPIKPVKNINIENFKIPKLKPTNFKNKIVENNLSDIPSNIPLHYIPYTSRVKKGNLTKKNSKSNFKNINGNSKKSGRNNIDLIKIYLMNIRKKIEANKIYPDIARKMGIEGAAEIEFTLNQNGSLKGIKILKTSGSKILDNAAINAVKSALPLPPIPAKLKMHRITVKLLLVFKLD